ncbi:hypothetical protein GCM10011382_05180 [Vreelandella lutescens]|uniref:Uncharacterized protein n=1 Tax=Vreelandella lutescens TaxID=1602943 RepID=A0ABQ1NIL2_9GAMM|nr:hypothetical protein GCM10011382_05180 [Halomonas lutescens]
MAAERSMNVSGESGTWLAAVGGKSCSKMEVMIGSCTLGFIIDDFIMSDAREWAMPNEHRRLKGGGKVSERRGYQTG